MNISSRPKLSLWTSDRFLVAACCSIIREAMNATVQAIGQSKAQIPSTECLGSGLIFLLTGCGGQVRSARLDSQEMLESLLLS